ncbi:MAG: radical SAM protein, partial [bacterium]|nr:radical SAM protein [bacterium]
DEGIATRGLLVRHLVLPYNLAGTHEIMPFIANEISKETYVNIMSQYHPMYLAHNYPLVSRSISPEEYDQAIDIAKKSGLRREF